MCDTLLKLQRPLEIRPAGQQGRNPCTAMVGTTIRLETAVQTKIFCYAIPSTPFLPGNRAVVSYKEEKREGKRGDVHVKGDWHTYREWGTKIIFSSTFLSHKGSISPSPLCLFHFRLRHSHFHSLSQLKGRFAYFPLSVPRRNAALPQAFAVFLSRQSPCNINPALAATDAQRLIFAILAAAQGSFKGKHFAVLSACIQFSRLTKPKCRKIQEKILPV